MITKRQVVIIAGTSILLLNVVQILIVTLYFVGAQGPDALYIYLNLAQMVSGCTVAVCLLLYLNTMNASFAEYCILIPSIVHTLYHTITFIVVYNVLNSPHTQASVVASLGFMLGAAMASVGPSITFLHKS